ncbi:MAG TPA: AAA family ATPase [Thermoanaerobaculia bacterium]|nr:AAA family ATPase [Thermoanaerobaculia bacterium]
MVRGERLVVVHGLGGIGKSTFSARFLERRRAEGARVLVVAASCRLTATALAAEVAAQLGVERTADQPQELAERCFREALGRALAGVTPTFLLLDNLEDNQDGEGRFCDPALAAALVDLGTLGGPGFRVLASSRLALVLPPGPLEPWNLDLGELSLSGCRKIRLLDREGLGSLDEAAWRQTLHHLGGHPKALELLGGYLRGHPDRARRLLREMDSAVEAVANKLAARQDRGRSLLLDAVLEAVPEDREPALDRLCLLTEPLPSAEIEALLTAEGLSRPAADLDWLRAHGFLARTVAPSALEGGDAVHRLLASRRQGALAAREGEVAARDWHLRIALHLVAPGRPLSDLGAAARHRDAAGDRAGALRLWSEWAATLRRRHAYLASAQLASQGLAAFPAGDDEGERAAAASLWLEIHQGLEPLGAIEDARAAIEKALALTAGATAPEALYVAAGAHLMKGRDQIHAGAVQEARSALEKAAAVFGEGGHAHDRAVALGSIADLLQQCGQLDEALRIRRDEQLPVFEALGDARMCAVTLGGIAEILQGRGQFDEALHIRRDQQIPVFEAIGDLPGRAIALGKIANILQLRGELDEALRIRIEEQLPIFEVLGDVRSHAYTLGQIAEIFRARGDLDEALRILREQQVPVLEALGDVRARAVALGEIANVLRARGELDEALWIRREQEIPAYETLGDVRSRAVALSRISEIYQLRGELEEAVRIVREEVIPVYEALGDVRELLIGRTNLAMGLLLRRRPGDAEEARHLLTLALPAAEALRLPEVLSIRALLAQAARGTSTMRKLMRRLGRPLGRGKGRAKRRR